MGELKKFKRILVANRGEIALRIMKTCREMGIESIGIFTEEERDLPHASFGDFSVSLGEGELRETYLNSEKIIEICREYKVDAVHPGYGFLSERASFALALEREGIILIGPRAETIEAMGDKKRSKQICEKVGVPIIPGFHGENQKASFLLEKAKSLGFPLLIKASAGGGGKGMRIVREEGEFFDALASVKRESMAAFGDDSVLLEKFMENPRHIEVQILSDSHGQHFHFYERECSLQRRYQKIIEESPATHMSENLRQRICAVATKLASSLHYLGAGTVEFILDGDTGEDFYFLEMNTRLQVEHPVTEMVTGFDLVSLQILVAQGQRLEFSQSDIIQRGHSIEVRLYAEDPDHDFMPSTGRLLFKGESEGSALLNGVRLDTGYEDGNEITTSFDPMLAKLIVYAPSRREAIEKIMMALKDYPFLGLTTNRDYLLRILRHQKFREGPLFTHFIKTYEKDLLSTPLTQREELQALLAFQILEGEEEDFQSGQERELGQPPGPWDSLQGLRLNES